MKAILLFLALVVSGCGYSSMQSEMMGQVKKVANRTPLICNNRVDADISLGVMRNGVGSMSSQDVWITVPEKSDQILLKKAAESGELVKITYDIARVTFCWEDHIVTHVEVVK